MAGAPDPGDAAGAAPPPSSGAALVAEACRRSGLLWVRPAGTDRSWPAWHVWHSDAVLVVSGPGEQPLPELVGDVEVVVPSADSGARLVAFLASARTLDPATPEWAEAAQALAAARLNAPDAAGLAERWAGTATLTRLEVSTEPHERPGEYPQTRGAAAPVPTPATTRTPRPFHLGRPEPVRRTDDGGTVPVPQGRGAGLRRLLRRRPER